MKSNKKLIAVIIAIIVVLLLSSVLATYLALDTGKYVNKAFKNLNQNSFTQVDMKIWHGEDVIFSDIKGEIYNPLHLEYEKTDKLNINFDNKLIKGKRIEDGNIVSMQGTVKDSVAFLGKEVEDLVVAYRVNIETEMVESLTIQYKQNNYTIEISAIK